MRRDVRGRGIGTLLLASVEDRARSLEAHVMVAAIDATNQGSIRFHERVGFVEVARMPEVGWHRGSWRTLVLVQKTLNPWSGLRRGLSRSARRAQVVGWVVAGVVVAVPLVGTVVAGKPLPARSDPMTTTTSMPAVLATGTDGVSGCTDVAGTPSSVAIWWADDGQNTA